MTIISWFSEKMKVAVSKACTVHSTGKKFKIISRKQNWSISNKYFANWKNLGPAVGSISGLQRVKINIENLGPAVIRWATRPRVALSCTMMWPAVSSFRWNCVCLIERTLGLKSCSLVYPSFYSFFLPWLLGESCTATAIIMLKN